MPDKPAKIQTKIKSLKLQTKAIQYVYLALSGVLLFIFTMACASDSANNRDHLVFRYNEHSNISSLDPAFARNPANIWPSNQLFNGLVQLDDNLAVQPDVAKSWQYVDSLKTYYFTLRNNVYFHKNECFGASNTRAVVASDFVYSFNRLIDPKVASPGS